ncbi:hypothetical protein ABE236_18320 [Priestia endophytica]|uniref:hypothetical protein n=1 Tax=Priestia endophytica TaxID=135735 RepID=UPI003D2E294C
MNSFSDAISKAVLNLVVDKESNKTFLEMEEGQNSIDMVLEPTVSVTFAMRILEKSLSKEDLLELISFMKERAEKG